MTSFRMLFNACGADPAVPGGDEEQERHVLPAAGAQLRPRQSGLVLHPAPQQVRGCFSS